MKNDIYFIAANGKTLYTVEKDKSKRFVVKGFSYKIISKI